MSFAWLRSFDYKPRLENGLNIPKFSSPVPITQPSGMNAKGNDVASGFLAAANRFSGETLT